MPFRIIRNDITKVRADAIVNTVNPNIEIGDGVENAIYKAAGEDKLFKIRKEIGVLQVGDVAVTEAFDLDARYIIHVSSPWWQDGNRGELAMLRMCYDKALKRAKNYGCESIAFPLLATGSYGFPKEIGIKIAVEAFTTFLVENEMEIILVVFCNEAVSISGRLVDEVRSFVDDRYVKESLKEEYGCVKSRCSSVQKFCAVPASIPLMEDSLDDTLKNIYTDSLEKHLQKIMNKKGLKSSEVYATANISKQYFSKLLKGQVKPSKEKMLALVIGLRLNMDEAVDFLRIAGYALSPISQTDIVVEYFIRKQEYNVLKIDIVLFDYGLEPLSNA